MTSQTYFPHDAQVLHVNDATVPFVNYLEDGIMYIGFDTSSCVPPEPMVNAMLALEFLKDSHTKIVMINHRSPIGLLAKVQPLVFSYKEGLSNQADLSQKHCAG